MQNAKSKMQNVSIDYKVHEPIKHVTGKTNENFCIPLN
jgi:hypothetical protein